MNEKIRNQYPNRVDNPEKAEAMARWGDEDRTKAAGAESESSKEYHLRNAENAEEQAGRIYDEERAAEERAKEYKGELDSYYNSKQSLTESLDEKEASDAVTIKKVTDEVYERVMSGASAFDLYREVEDRSEHPGVEAEITRRILEATKRDGLEGGLREAADHLKYILGPDQRQMQEQQEESREAEEREEQAREDLAEVYAENSEEVTKG